MKSLDDIVAALPGLESGMLLACDWLVDIAQVQTEQLTIEKNTLGLGHKQWKGSFRGEYSVARRTWNFFGPVWHGGQAIKALTLAYSLAGDERLLRSAHLGAQFILGNQITAGPDAGLILAYEEIDARIYTSSVIECLDGLFVLGKASERREYIDAAVNAARWCREKAWIRGQGLMLDLYDLQAHEFVPNACVARDNGPGRPLVEDAVWLTSFRHTGEEAFRNLFYEVIHRLIKDERPAGNWVDYGPCRPKTGECHPRHAFWWGSPMLDAWQDTGETRYLDAARRAGTWYVKAMRNDGGMFRFTDHDFNTTSFDHATSGAVCAAILWTRLYQETGETIWLEPIRRAMGYALKMQFTNPEDPNLKGCILEKVLPPDGTDRNPYHIRDLGTIFFIQAAALLLRATKHQRIITGKSEIHQEIAAAP